MTDIKPITFTLTVRQCLDISQKVSFCQSNEATRYYLKGTLFAFSLEHMFEFAAMDGLRCSLYRITPPTGKDLHVLPDMPFNRIFPPEAMELLGKLDKKRAEENVIIFTIEGMKLTIANGATTMTFMCIDGNFPDYKRVIPEKPAPTIKFNAAFIADLANMLKQSGDRSGFVTPHITDDKAPVHVTIKDESLTHIFMPARF